MKLIRTLRHWKIIGLVIACLVLILFLIGFIAPMISWKNERIWTCSTCGAKKQLTKHLLWGTIYPDQINDVPVDPRESEPGVAPSPLTVWMKKNNVPHTHTWRSTSDRTDFLFGFGHRYRCSTPAPPIYSMPRIFLERFVQKASEQQVRHLLQTLAESPDNEARAELNQYCQFDFPSSASE